MRRLGRWRHVLFFLVLDRLLDLHSFPEGAFAVPALRVRIPAFLQIVLGATFLNFNHIPLFFPPSRLLLIIPKLSLLGTVVLAFQFTVLQLQSADLVLEILEDAAQGVVDLAEVGEKDGWVLLMRGRVLVELQVRVSVHLLLIYN